MYKDPLLKYSTHLIGPSQSIVLKSNKMLSEINIALFTIRKLKLHLIIIFLESMETT